MFFCASAVLTKNIQKKNNLLFGFADWVLRRGARHLVHSRQIIISFAADRVLRGESADRGVHAGARH